MSCAIIVVPCFNEANRIDTRRFQQFAAGCNAVRFLFVNDGSTDGTLGVLERLHAVAQDRFRFVHLSRNSGKAEAVRHGMLTALRERPQYVGYWDADLATPLEEIPRFCQVLDEQPGVQLVIGARMPLLGHRIQRRPLRRWLGRLFAGTASLALAPESTTRSAGPSSSVRAPLAPNCSSSRSTRAGSSTWRSSPAWSPAKGTWPAPAWRRSFTSIRSIAGEVAGSKLKSSDFVKAFGELAQIYWNYLRPGVAASPAVAARLAASGHLPASAGGRVSVAPEPAASESRTRRAA